MNQFKHILTSLEMNSFDFPGYSRREARMELIRNPFLTDVGNVPEVMQEEFWA